MERDRSVRERPITYLNLIRTFFLYPLSKLCLIYNSSLVPMLA